MQPLLLSEYGWAIRTNSPQHVQHSLFAVNLGAAALMCELPHLHVHTEDGLGAREIALTFLHGTGWRPADAYDKLMDS